MKWDLEEIKKIYETLSGIKTESGYKKYFTPYRFLRSIDWDKVSYDGYCLKLQANDLPEAQRITFQYIYDRVQDILADLMDLSIINPKVIASCKTQFELFQPAFGREKEAKKFYSDIQRYNDIKSAENKSPISILGKDNDNSTTNI